MELRDRVYARNLLSPILHQQSVETRNVQHSLESSVNEQNQFLNVNETHQVIDSNVLQQTVPPNVEQQHAPQSQPQSSSMIMNNAAQYLIQSDGSIYMADTSLQNVYVDTNSFTADIVTPTEQPGLHILEGYILIKQSLYDSILKMNASLSVQFDELADRINKKVLTEGSNASTSSSTAAVAVAQYHHKPIETELELVETNRRLGEDQKFKDSWVSFFHYFNLNLQLQ